MLLLVSVGRSMQGIHGGKKLIPSWLHTLAGGILGKRSDINKRLPDIDSCLMYERHCNSRALEGFYSCREIARSSSVIFRLWDNLGTSTVCELRHTYHSFINQRNKEFTQFLLHWVFFLYRTSFKEAMCPNRAACMRPVFWRMRLVSTSGGWVRRIGEQ